jgi:hypothetical protein
MNIRTSFASLVIVVGLLSAARLSADPVTYSFDDTLAHSEGYTYRWAGKGVFTVDFGANVFGVNYYGYNLSGQGGSLDAWTSVVLDFTVEPYLQLVIYSDPATGQVIWTGGYDLGVNDRFASPLDEWNAFRDYYARYGLIITPVAQTTVPESGSSLALLSGALFAVAAVRRLFR